MTQLNKGTKNEILRKKGEVGNDLVTIDEEIDGGPAAEGGEEGGAIVGVTAVVLVGELVD